MKVSILARAVCFALGALSCSKDSDTTQTFPAAGAGPRANASPQPKRAVLPAPTTFVSGRLRKLAAFGDELRKRIEPAQSGWPSEVLADRAERELARAVERVLGGGDGADAAFATLLSPDFKGASSLIAVSRTKLFDDGCFLVQGTTALDPTPQAPDQFTKQLSSWRGSFAGLRFESLDLHVVGVTARAGGGWSTRVTLRPCAVQDGRRQQQNLIWNVEWSAAGDPRLATIEQIELTKFEEVDVQHPPFQELTRAVLAKLPFLDEELLRGAGEYHLHQDRLAGAIYLGMHGLAIGDVNGDGLDDVFLPQAAGQPNRLMLHQPDGTLVDVTAQCGIGVLDNAGPALILDLDGDGNEDIAVAVGPHLIVHWNDGHGHFTEETVLSPPDEPEITSMSAADVDHDGDLDIFCCRYVKGGVAGGAPVPYYNAENGATNLYWRNEGGRQFKEAAAEVGLDVHSTRFSLALIFDDFDEDGWPDLYVVNDFGRKSLYHNDHGHFHDITEAAGLADQGAGMGVDLADVDLDGRLDMYVTDMYSPAGLRVAAQPEFMPEHPELRAAYLYHARGNALFLNKGDGTYVDATDKAGLAPGGWAWGSKFFDWNGDGYEDIYVPNGFVTNPKPTDMSSFFWREVVGRSPAVMPPTDAYSDAWDALRHFTQFEGWTYNGRERNYAYLNLGAARFADVSAAAAVDFLDDARVCASVDWDDDGHADLWLRNRTSPQLRLLRNTCANGAHFLSIDLVGPGGQRDAIGATVRLDFAGQRPPLRQTVRAAQGFMCQSSRRLLFGLGASERIPLLSVSWPDGTRAELRDVACDQRLRIREGAGAAEVRPQMGGAAAGLPVGGFNDPPTSEPRIVLYAPLPIAPVPLPRFDGPERTFGSLAGKLCLVTIARGSDARCTTWLEGLARVRADLERVGVTQVVLLGGETAEREQGRALLTRLGLAEGSGPYDEAFAQILQVLLIEVLGPFEQLPMPVQLLVDRESRLVVVYAAEDDPVRLSRDLQLAVSLPAGAALNERLLEGRWLKEQKRDFSMVAQVLSLLGQRDLAEYYQKLSGAGH